MLQKIILKNVSPLKTTKKMRKFFKNFTLFYFIFSFIIHLFKHSFRSNTNIFISRIYSSSFINIFLTKKKSCFVLLIERRFIKYYLNCVIWKEFFSTSLSLLLLFIIYSEINIFKATTKKAKESKSNMKTESMIGERMKPRNS